MWGWRFGYTAAQIELAIADAPFVDYKTDKKGKKKDFKDADALSVLQAQERWEQNKKKGKKHFSSAMFETDKKE